MNKLLYLSLLIFFITPKSYAENMCSSLSSNAESGTIYDSGGAGGSYSNNENCGFLIQPTSSPSDITLSFSQFSVEPSNSFWGTIYDYLDIYDGTSASDTLIGRFYGATLPSSVTATSGSMYLRFISDFSLIYPGFTATWTSSEPELIASYNFDDDWITNNSLTDQTGNYNGSPGGSVSRVLAGANGAKGDTCRAGSFSGGDIDITGLPVSTATGAKTSVSFWMYWDGTNNVMPMGWGLHDLWLWSGFFGFNTFGGDVTGISSVGLSSGWHHVAAVFTNGSVSNNKLYIDGVLKVISHKTGVIYTANAIVQSALRIGGVLSNSGFNFRGMIDNFKIYTGEISQAQVTADMNESNACAAKANWHMDESSWNGTLNEVEDSSGNSHSGTSSNGASTDQTTPAIVGTPGTCSYGKFNGINQKVTIPYSNALNPDSFTISFWAKVEGGNGTWRSPITSRSNGVSRQGFIVYAGTDNLWQFWTGTGVNSWDILKGAAVVNNSWTHIAISFIKTSALNGNLSGTKKLFINGLLSAQALADYRPNSINPLFIGAGSNNGPAYFFNGSIDEMQLFDSVLSQNQIQTIMAETHPCSNGGGGDTPATNFNCVENGTDGITGNLYTKTTAQSFSFDIVALQDASTIETSFASGADHAVTVELVNAETAASCDSYPVLSPAVSQSLNITASDSGTKTSASMTSSTAYSKVKCRVTDATDSPSVIGCSTDSFAIRPTVMTISSNLTNTGSTGLPKAKAGDSFTLTATATAGYNGTPNINNSNIQAHAGAIQAGSISGAFSAADSVTGITTGNAFSYSEVGLLRFTAQGIYDDSFTMVDQASDCTDSFSNTADAAGKVGCKFGNTSISAYFGRFTPDHFKITASVDGVFADACTGFTYNGQTFSYQTAPTLTVTAYNGLSTATVTANYTGSSYAKLIATNFNVTAPTTDSTQLGSDGSTLVNIESWIPGVATLADNGDGSLTFSFGADDYIYQHENNSKIASFIPTINLEFTDITDSDDIQTQSLPHSIQASGTSIRFGRLNIDNAHGSELVDLPVSLTTQYWDGTNWILNDADQCSTTSLSVTDPILADGLIPSELCVLDAGSPGNSNLGCSLADTSIKKFNEPPAAINPGDFNLNFKAPGNGNIGSLDITADTEDYLKYNWKGLGSTNPTARVTFGIYKGNSKQIYFREVY